MTVPCFYPSREDFDTDEPPEEWGEWRPESGECNHADCIEGNRIGRLYRSAQKVRSMTLDEIQSIRADHELMRDEFHGREWTLEESGYVIVAEEAS